MKIITNDYSCGTSSAFLDYGTDSVIICAEQEHKHVFDIQGEDLFFVGHDVMMYLWDSEKYRNHWKNYKGRKIIWCFEKIDCIVPQWQVKSHYSLELCQQFTDEFVASDEQDCRKYGMFWLPQWASNRFYNQREQPATEKRILFSGQAGFVGYGKRDELLKQVSADKDQSAQFYFSNTIRKFGWDEYIHNFLNHEIILAPFGNLKAFNTRTFEALTSGRLLLQQVDDEYKWHIALVEQFPNVKFFTTFEDLKKILSNELMEPCHRERQGTDQYNQNNLFERFRRIGIEL